MAIKYSCSNGEKISQSQIDTRRSAAYRRMYDSPSQTCRGCGKVAQGTAHIVPQARAKQLGMAELCYTEDNMIPACHKCNAILENIQSEEFKQLFCYNYVIKILEKYDRERFQKATSW